MSVEIKYIDHSFFLISHDNCNVAIDPFIAGETSSKNSLNSMKIDDILLTHAHGDHLGESIELSKIKGTNITGIFELANYCMRKGASASGINMGGEISFPWGKAIWLPASHSSSTPDGQYAGSPASILVKIGNLSIYHAGDTGLHADMKMIGDYYKPDISLLPIGGYYTMGINEAVEAAKWLGSKKIIPMHYNTFPPIQADPSEFKEKIEAKTEAECIILKPGEWYRT